MKTIIIAFIFFLITNLAQAYDVTQLLVDMRERFDKIDDYECVMVDYQSMDDKHENYTYNFYYKKPNKIRMDIIGGDNNIGTVLIYGKGKVKVKPGRGLLSHFTFTLDPYDRRILGLNGFTVHESAGDYFLDKHIENIDNFDSRLIEEDELYGIKTLVIELISKDIAQTASIAKELVWVDRERLLLLKFVFYDINGDIMQSTEYRNLNLNAGLKDELFRKTKYKRK